MNKVIRQEYKYFINNEELLFLRASLARVMKLDSYCNSPERNYLVSSIYFDTPYNDDLEDKQAGILSREKFRIRTYDKQISTIKIESKQRIDTAIHKTSSVLSLEDAGEIIKGEYACLKRSNDEFLNELYTKLKAKYYKPSIIVNYNREAYLLPYGNIRITFDLNLRTEFSNIDFFSVDHSSAPVFLDGMQILEVKFSSALPSYITEILSRITAKRSAISKFVLGQKYTDHSPTRDRIFAPF